MEMVVRSMETAEMAMETDGDGSEGTSPSQQGAGTETSVPQNSPATVPENSLMRHGVDNVKHHLVGNPKRKV
jgi:hypothetical protein